MHRPYTTHSRLHTYTDKSHREHDVLHSLLCLNAHGHSRHARMSGRMAALSLLCPATSSGLTRAGTVWLLNRGLVESLRSETGYGTHEAPSDAMPKRPVQLQNRSDGTSSLRHRLVVTFHLMFVSLRIVPGASFLPSLPLTSLALKVCFCFCF